MMTSLEDDQFDPNWVCCLLQDIPAFSFDSHDISWPASSPCVSTQDCPDESCRKRVRSGSSSAPSSKACREKIRRDRVNERFLELSAVLEPGMSPKCDKAAILTDAVRVVNMLHEETSRLKEQNMKLKDKIVELKSEKNELRAEKHRLKEERENMEKKIKALGAHNHHLNLQFHPAPIPASYAFPYGAKLLPFMNNPGVSLWQFVPQTAVDTSQDHVLHPPVA